MKDYIDNTKFETLIYQYQDGDTSVEEELFKYYSILIDRILLTYKFKIDFEEAKQECLLLVVRILKNRNFNKGSGAAFNYFTTVILNNLKLLYSKDKKYKEKLETYKEVKYGDISVSSLDP